MRTIRDTWLVFERSMWLTIHNPAWLIVGLLQPIVYLVLFAPLLNSLAQMPGFPPGGAFNVFVPGLLVLTAMFGALFVGFGLLAELRAGVIERMRVTPMSRIAMLLGRAFRDVVVFLVQALLLVVLSLPFGLRVDPAGLLVSVGLLVLIGLVMAPFSYAVALALRSEDAFAPLVNAIALPLMLLSGIMLPMSLAPAWLRTIATLNPIYHAVLAVRALFNGGFGDPEVAIGVAVMTILAVVAVAVAARSFSRAVA